MKTIDKLCSYGLKHALTLHRNHNNDAIIKSAEQGEIGGEARDSVTDRKIDIEKIPWHMPHIQLSIKLNSHYIRI